MIEHMEKLELLEKGYPRLTGGDAKDCEPLIEEFTQVSFRSVIEGLKSEGLEKQEKCVLDYLRTHRWPENNMKHSVYAVSTHLTPDEKTVKYAELIKANTDAINESLELCK